MLSRVLARVENEEMTPTRRRKYEQRRSILGPMSATLQLDQSEATRQKVHDFCFNMTDISRRNKSPDINWDGIDAIPRDLPDTESERSEHGYCPPNRVPGRSVEGEGRASSSSAIPNRNEPEIEPNAAGEEESEDEKNGC